ncbi:TIGR04168 family protein [Thermosynechococcaceae cyanobacterium BACA0444]|uniref:TIGR04168 family protein n=1 Tax=Pseudocalidococcus azoricus BACA0444 TaxID=2918990 RepID=A0AAE4FTS2_9CYAN|nr:TIGR04168 family protein [Pseudocalidococcus azoricus]MDS3861204.1 TIGR04168 family protein [Pseudocalidococcus azoricus BACA0444]
MTVITSSPDLNIKTIAVVGDIHELWNSDDTTALKLLNVDVALFVGDFGNEAVAVVQGIAAIDLPKAVALGNHDAWYSATDWGRKKCPYNRQIEDRVQQQLDLLGVAHVGYGYRDFPSCGFAVVGGRPFSWGGPELKNIHYLQERFGIHNLSESTAEIIQAARQAPTDTLWFISHNGPAGLGDYPESPCGRDWQPLGGDFGDPDLAAAIQQLKQEGKRIPLVAFGHMHHRLRHRNDRQRTPIAIHGDTIYLNAAVCPRMIQAQNQTWRTFMVVFWDGERIMDINQAWVNVKDQRIQRQSLLHQANLQPFLPQISTIEELNLSLCQKR